MSPSGEWMMRVTRAKLGDIGGKAATTADVGSAIAAAV